MWICRLLLIFAAIGAGADEVLVPKGIYSPFFRDEGETDQTIESFKADRRPVTNREFLAFVRAQPEWRRSNVKSVFAESNYLEHWTGDLDFASSAAERPVTNVSWFAARKYCESFGKRLMQTAEWEYASQAQRPENLKLILDWYGRPEGSAGRARNSFGLQDMHGLIWEWVEDFSSAIVSGDSRSQNENTKAMFCGGGALKAKDPGQYATFMRIAHRSSLSARSVGRLLGFRCARSIQRTEKL